jgi:hypothetical protein
LALTFIEIYYDDPYCKGSKKNPLKSAKSDYFDIKTLIDQPDSEYSLSEYSSDAFEEDSHEPLKLIGFPIKLRIEDLKNYLEEISVHDFEFHEVRDMKTFVNFG